MTPVPDKSLSELLVAGDLDAVLAARPIPAYRNRHPDICRLFENFAEVEKDYVRRTKIFPIMHTIAVRKAVLDEAPWLAANLFTAFEEAKRRSIARVSHEGVPMVPIPWALAAVREAKSVLGDDYFPYGVAANKPTLGCVSALGLRARRLPPPPRRRRSISAADADLGQGVRLDIGRVSP